MIKKILCAVDDTQFSKAAITVAADLAKGLNADLTFLVVNKLTGAYGHGGAATYVWNDSTVKRLLDGAAKAAKKAGVQVVKCTNVASRDIGRAIVIYAEENDIDHIVVGTGDKTGVSRLMIGSISSDVVERAHCPVTVARV
jgi:nucleotide-binding universal stress UspA family protein